MPHIGALFLSGTQKSQRLHACTQKTLSFRRNFTDLEKAVRIQAPSHIQIDVYFMVYRPSLQCRDCVTVTVCTRF